MEEFNFINPSAALAPFVKYYWLLKTVGDETSLIRTVPTGMISLIFHRGNRLLSVSENECHPQAFLSGQERSYFDLKYTGQIDMIVVVFKPIGARSFFSLPIDKVTGLRLTADDLEDKELMELERMVTVTVQDHKCIHIIEQFLLNRLTMPTDYNLNRVSHALNLLNRGETDVTNLADATCLSTKQFNRVFSEIIGARPKEYSRIIRFQKALYLLEKRRNISLTTLAYSCGYFDQSHMIKDFKSLSGYTPGEYLDVCSPHSDYFD